jgi:predicted acyl esterase
LRRSTLGWTKSNEISNGRWVMFGLLVGMMTEYATGVDFPNQLKLTVSVLGIADVYE